MKGDWSLDATPVFVASLIWRAEARVAVLYVLADVGTPSVCGFMLDVYGADDLTESEVLCSSIEAYVLSGTSDWDVLQWKVDCVHLISDRFLLEMRWDYLSEIIGQRRSLIDANAYASTLHGYPILSAQRGAGTVETLTQACRGSKEDPQSEEQIHDGSDCWVAGLCRSCLAEYVSEDRTTRSGWIFPKSVPLNVGVVVEEREHDDLSRIWGSDRTSETHVPKNRSFGQADLHVQVERRRRQFRRDQLDVESMCYRSFRVSRKYARYVAVVVVGE